MKGRKEREDYSLKETEKVYDAVKLTSTTIKDYSLQHVVHVSWRPTNEKQRLVGIRIGDSTALVRPTELFKVVGDMVDKDNEDGWLPRVTQALEVAGKHKLVIDTTEVNEESLRDHVADVTVGEEKALIDLEELLKAARYG